MPKPTISEVHIDQPLTNISIAFIQSQDVYIADKVFPIVPVEKQSDRYFVYKIEDWLRDEAQLRAPSTESAGGGWSIDNTPTYYCEKYAFHKDIDDDIRRNMDQPLDAERDATLFITTKMLIKREVLWAQKFFKNGVWATDIEGGVDIDKWSDPNTDPVSDITEQVFTIASKTGFKPNTLVLSPDVFVALKNHPKILDRVKYTQRAVITTDILAGLFEVEKVLVPIAVYNQAPEGGKDVKFVFNSGSALLVYTAPSPGILIPSGGYIFSWRELGQNSQGIVIRRFRMEHLKSDRIEGEIAFDMKVVAPDLGVFFYNLL